MELSQCARPTLMYWCARKCAAVNGLARHATTVYLSRILNERVHAGRAADRAQLWEQKLQASVRKLATTSRKRVQEVEGALRAPPFRPHSRDPSTAQGWRCHFASAGGAQ